MKRIYLLATGGTIACRSTKHGYEPVLDGAALLNALPELQCEITVRDLMCVDSTDVTTEQRAAVVREIWENRSRYDGFVVTHGTDTMAYTAAVLYRALEAFDRPVIVTGSMHPLGVPGSDAEDNLSGALAAACSDYRGAALLCGGLLLRGCDAVKFHSERVNAFTSVGGAPDGTWKNGRLTVLRHPPEGSMSLRPPRNIRTAVLSMSPGFAPEVLLACRGLDAAVLLGYGMGGVPSGLVEAAEAVVQSGTRVLISTQCACGPADCSVYAVGQRIERAGAVCLGTQSVEDALACIACGIA